MYSTVPSLEPAFVNSTLPPSFATPKLVTIDGRRWCFVFARDGLVGFEPAGGKVDFQFPWRSSTVESVNASDPVVVGERVFIGAGVILHHNASIGADGFSYAMPEDGSVESAKARGTVDALNTEIVRINSIGTVILEDGVEVGALSAVDRGTVAATVVGRNTKIDNLVTVGHNVVIGRGCLICGQVGISGSCTIGDRVVLGGQVGVADHLTIGDDAVIAAGSGVGTNVPPKSVYVGYPAVPRNKFAEVLLYGNRLRPMFEDLAELKRRLKAIESGSGG